MRNCKHVKACGSEMCVEDQIPAENLNRFERFFGGMEIFTSMDRCFFSRVKSTGKL